MYNVPSAQVGSHIAVVSKHLASGTKLLYAIDGQPIKIPRHFRADLTDREITVASMGKTDSFDGTPCGIFGSQFATSGAAGEVA